MSLKGDFVRNLKRFRKTSKISQMKLAQLCDTDVSYIGQIEMGKRFPSVKLIEKMAAALNVEPYWLFMSELDPHYDDLAEDEDIISALPLRIRNQMVKELTSAISACVKETLTPEKEGQGG
ncbi:MAG: helix-turn-helix transcriptional regulator [Treponema sp.]|jgi:transcriptional regulator with XRE-family HTH domain|nr:helix-turn-helix transcriptional regulator [Treponema sp.]